MLIKDLESQSGLDRATIRFYEKEGLIQPTRQENGYRSYSERDLNTLLKIKLLRQLGMSVYKIKGLQEGSEDFSQALADQVRYLNDRIEEQRRARALCLEISGDGARYEDLDAAWYLKRLREMSTEQSRIGQQDFKETVPEEIHPWRRYIARMLDYLLLTLIINIVLFVLLRIRPLPGQFGRLLVTMAAVLLFVPVEAFLLHKWGTTPGKWTMGIRLEYIQGGNLPWDMALWRSWEVYKTGMCGGIPFLESLANLYHYFILTGRAFRGQKYNEVSPPSEMDWDEDTEITYSKWAGKEKAILAAVLAGLLLLDGIVAMDMLKPKYRGNEITIAEFAENYNFYLTVDEQYSDTEYSASSYLQSDGTFAPEEEGVFVIHTSGQPVEERDFEYTLEGDHIRSITYRNTWTEIFFINPLEPKCINAAISVLMAQDGMNLFDLKNFSEAWEQEISSGSRKCSVQYENIEIAWQIEPENCDSYNGRYHREDETKESSLTLDFTIVIH